MRKLAVGIAISIMAISQITGCSSKQNMNKKEQNIETEANTKDKHMSKEEIETTIEESLEIEQEQISLEKESNVENSSIIYINDNRIDLISWKEKDLDTILTEIENTGVVFNKISGTNNSDKQDMILNKEVVKQSINDIGSYGHVTIYFGECEFSNDMSITINPESKLLQFKANMSDDNEYKKSFKLGDNKYTYEDLHKIGLDSILKDTNLFDRSTDIGLEANNMNYEFSSTLLSSYIYTFDIKNCVYENTDTAREISQIDTQDKINNTSIIEYQGKKLNIADLINETDVNNVIDKLTDYGFSGTRFEFSSYHTVEDFPNINLETDSIDEIRKEYNNLISRYDNDSEAFKQSSYKLWFYLNPTEGEKTGDITIVYSCKYYQGEVDNRTIHIMREENENSVLWTNEKVNLNSSNVETTSKICSDMNEYEPGRYRIKNDVYELEVVLDEFEPSILEEVIVTKQE